ncbi:Flagellar basal-body P-ring formation protein flgA [Enterobacter cancerogenus]|nr:Flagellar basal-body P-ring formation protein flgA [Enterobacter cancerogenus]
MYFPARLLFLTAFIVTVNVVNSARAVAATEPLIEQITTLVNQDAKKGLSRTVVILTPEKELETLCAAPKLAMTGSDYRLGGKRSISARCDGRNKFIQIDVQASAQWWVAKRALKPNTVIQADDISTVKGSASHLSTDVIMADAPIVGLVVTRMINVGQPLRTSQLRQGWNVLTNQAIDLEVSGDGFLIRSRGKALNNAGLGEPVRVKTASGQIVYGTVIDNGKANVTIKK